MEAKFLLLLQIQYTIPSTHWIMTESGKIEAQVRMAFASLLSKKSFQPDSIFFMRQPHDFVAFLHQEQRHHDINSLHEKLSMFRYQIQSHKIYVLESVFFEGGNWMKTII